MFRKLLNSILIKLIYHIYPNLNYLVVEIKERELISERLSKYIASFNYFDKSLIALSVTTGSSSVASFATVIAALVGIVSASFILVFPMFTGIVKKLLKTTRNKKKNSIKVLC